jgi:hypothetical protein
MKNIGIILIVMGALALIYTGYSFSTKEKVVDLGAIEITHQKKHAFDWPPIAGCVLILAGAGFILGDRKGTFFK